jgi:hypothetical protein
MAIYGWYGLVVGHGDMVRLNTHKLSISLVRLIHSQISFATAAL